MPAPENHLTNRPLPLGPSPSLHSPGASEPGGGSGPDCLCEHTCVSSFAPCKAAMITASMCCVRPKHSPPAEAGSAVRAAVSGQRGQRMEASGESGLPGPCGWAMPSQGGLEESAQGRAVAKDSL